MAGGQATLGQQEAKPEAQAILPAGRPHLGQGLGGVRARLFIFGFQVLFLQLLLIRYLAGHIWNLGYFPNLVLLAAFIGFGFGFLLHGRISERLSARLYGLLPAILLAFLLLILWLKPVAVIGHDIERIEIGGELYFSNRDEALDPPWLQAVKFAFWFLGVVGMFFLIGQRMAKLFRLLRPLEAYSLDISGSLAGIALFIAISWFQVTAAWWFLVLAASYWLAVGGDVRPAMRIGSALAACALSLVTFLYDNPSLTNYSIGSHPLTDGIRKEIRERAIPGVQVREQSEWSPYQRLTAVEWPGIYGRILANGISHQEWGGTDIFLGAPYTTTHELRAALSGEQFRNVLVIGSGSGNDVAAALQFGAERVDAVEIDPAIARFGYSERGAIQPPYLDPRVFLHIDDGRHYLFNTDRRYDLIILALTDSLVKVSSVSQLRLENYLFTANAFRKAVDLLEPGGWFVMYNAYRQEWLIQKLEQMMAQALPAGSDIAIESLAEDDWEWRILMGRTPPAPGEPLAGDSAVDHGIEPATDDWPFPYMRERAIPPHYLAAMALVIGIVAVALTLFGRPTRRSNPYFSVAFTLMGAAFLLLETKGIIQFSLLFGTTWLNSSLVFFAVLLSILMAIWVADRVRWPRLLPVASVLIFVATSVSLVVPLDALLAFDPLARFLLASALMFAPVFLANLIFSVLFRDRLDAELYFGWNLLGATIGGVLEYVSIATGYQALGAVVIALYAAALLCAWKGLRMSAGEGARAGEATPG